MMCAPGNYRVALSKQVDGEVSNLSEPVEFEVVPLRSGSLPGSGTEAAVAFWREYEAATKLHSAIQHSLAQTIKRIDAIDRALVNTAATGDLDNTHHQLKEKLLDIDLRLNGNRAKQETGEKHPAVPGERLGAVGRGVDRSSYGPTATHRKQLDIASEEIDSIGSELGDLAEEISQLAKSILAAGGPWVEGTELPK